MIKYFYKIEKFYHLERGGGIMEILIGSKLKQLRTEKKLSIAELSRLSDVSTGLISQIERDLVVPSVTSLS